MTNAIEQTKREMYGVLSNLAHLITKAENRALEHYESATMEMQLFQCKLEAYLELLRQDQEALHETARKRFEDIQSLEAGNEKLSKALRYTNETIQRCAAQSLETISDLESKLARMTEERDSLRNRMQAYEERESQASTSGQTSGENASCATLDGKTEAILGAVVDVRQIVSDWAVYGYKAKKQMKKLAYAINNNPELHAAMLEFEKPADSYGNWFISNGSDNCQHAYHNGKCLYCLKIGH